MAYADFPKAQDILAIARVESRFIENAQNKRSRGVMQVNDGPWDVTKNMIAGVKLLREYYQLLGNEKAAITAYNCGPSNYRKGRCKDVYYVKVKGHVNAYEQFVEQKFPAVPIHTGGSDLGDRDVVRPGQDNLSAGGLLLPEDGQTGEHRAQGAEVCGHPQDCASGAIRESLGSVKE